MKPQAQTSFIRRTEHALRDAARIRTVHASRLKGRPLSFLSRIWDIDQAPWQETDRGDTLPIFRAPTLEEAAPKLFEQDSLFPEDRLERDWTVFDLFGQVLADVREDSFENLRVDHGMLDSLYRYEKSFSKGFESASFEYRRDGPRKARVDRPLVEKAGEALQRTPPTQRVRLVGRLDMLRMSNRLFQLILADSSRVSGVWDGDPSALKTLLGEETLVEGSASFRPSGDIGAIQAEAARAALPEDEPFRRKPVAKGPRARLEIVEGRKTFAGIVGRWPGDETDEEVEEFLREIS